MKRIFILLGFILTTFTASAQSDSWIITINNKTIINTNNEDEKKNTKKVKPEEWKKNGFLEIRYKEANPNTWWRSFLFYDKDDNELARKDSVLNYKINLKDLIKKFPGKKEIRIYTTISPKDPNMAIRIRRVHLCTLQLQ